MPQTQKDWFNSFDIKQANELGSDKKDHDKGEGMQPEDIVLPLSFF